MGLTSKKVLLLTVVLAVALFVLTIWLWPRLSKRDWRAVLGRVGLLVATQLALFGSIGLAANKSFGFYASWADLFGQEQQQGVVVDHDTGPNGTRLKVVGHQSVNVPGGSTPGVGGRIDKVEIHGDESKISSPAYVYLPPEYFQPRYSGRKFPASVVLTGYPGTAEALIKGLHYPQTAHRLAKENKAQPLILVMLRPTVTGQRDTECMNVPNGPQAATFFAKDLPKDLRGAYRIGHDRRSLGIVGNSTGGFCALKLSMEYPEVFSAAASLSGYFKPADDPTTGDLYQGDEKLRRESDLLWRQRHLPATETSFLVTTSKQGESNYKPTLRFIQQTKSPARISSIILDSGGHSFNTWRREIPGTLQWISGRLNA